MTTMTVMTGIYVKVVTMMKLILMTLAMKLIPTKGYY